MKIFVVVALLSFCGFNRAVYSAEPPQNAATPQQDVWFNVTDIGQTIIEQKKTLVLTPEVAAKIFQKKFPYFVDGWQEKLGQPIEEAANARKFDELPDGVQRAMIKLDGETFAALQAFSKSELCIKILKSKGQYLWHRYYECLADFQVPRTKTLDEIFDLKILEQKYTTQFKGIGYGDGEQTVVKALGKPDAIQIFQPVGMLRYSYNKDNVSIYFENFVVKTITHGHGEKEKQKP